MQIVIDMPDVFYNQIKSTEDFYLSSTEKAIKNGTPLSKEIVTCKDCKHSRTCVIEEKTHRFCNCEKHRLQEVADDYFCGDGERRERVNVRTTI